MPLWLASIIGTVLNLFATHSTEIVSGVGSTITDGTSIFHDIAHGEGGVSKLEKVAGDLAVLAGHAQAVLTTVKAAGA